MDFTICSSLLVFLFVVVYSFLTVNLSLTPVGNLNITFCYCMLILFDKLVDKSFVGDSLVWLQINRAICATN